MISQKKDITLYESIALIVSGTIGAGVLGIPYAVSRVGIFLGVCYILLIGLLMIGLNLMVGEVVSKIKENIQMVGLSRKYLGKTGGFLMSALVYLMAFGVLVVYIIGEGHSLSALFGGSSFFWSVLFFVFASFLVFIGLNVVKKVELFSSLSLIVVVLLITLVNIPHLQLQNFTHLDWKFIFFPYGILLFAYSGVGAIPEVKSIIKGNKKLLKKAIVWAGVINATVYTLFALVVVGVTGLNTTEVATIGLGEKVGFAMLVLGNLFAILAMGNSFLLLGTTLKDSFIWDFKLSNFWSSLLVVFIPIIIFLAGVREFIKTIDLIGGVFLSAQMLLLLLIYWKAKQSGDLEHGRFKLHNTLFLLVVLLLAFSVGVVYSILKWF